jgi:integrase
MSSAKNVFRQFLNDNHRAPDIHELKELLDIELRQSPRKEKLNFFSFAEKHTEQSKTRINTATGKIISPKTTMLYRRTIKSLREFSRHTGQRIDFDTITVDLYNSYIEYLNQKGLATNTIGQCLIKTWKTFLNAATEEGLNTNLAFKSKRFKKLTEESDSIYLSTSELDELFKLDLSTDKKLEKVRDLFLVGCWTGLRFSDFTSIAPENIKGDSIEIETIKTKERVVIPIHTTIRKIMKKYKGVYPNSLPPKTSNVNTNKYLKEIGKMVPSLHTMVQTSITRGGVKVVTNRPKYELLVTHTARRSFATNLHLSGLSPIIIMKITGHRTQKCFMTYLKVTMDENAELLRKHWEKKKKVTTTKEKHYSHSLS